MFGRDTPEATNGEEGVSIEEQGGVEGGDLGTEKPARTEREEAFSKNAEWKRKEESGENEEKDAEGWRGTGRHYEEDE